MSNVIRCCQVFMPCLSLCLRMTNILIHVEGMGAVLRFEVEVNVRQMSREGKHTAAESSMLMRQISLSSQSVIFAG